MDNFIIDRRSLAERVAEKIESFIKEEDFSPGDKIPNEYEWARKLSVGRSTVREAIKLLVSRNVLEIRRGSGTFVCNNTGFVEDPLGLRFESDKGKVALDLAKIRLLIEPQMAYEAAQYSTETDIEELHRINEAVDQLIDEGVDYSKPDAQLHVKICSISGNLIMPKLIPVITSSIVYYTKFTDNQHPADSSEDHMKIIKAIQNHDAQLAHNLMYEHVNSVIYRITQEPFYSKGI